MNIRIAGTEFSLKNKSFEIYIQGCWRGCPGCHNPGTHSFIAGELVNITQYVDKIANRIYPFKELIKNIYISGGDLLCYGQDVAEDFSNHIKYSFHPSYKIWLFTGAGTEDAIPDWIWYYYDVVKSGMYKENLRNPEGTFPASSNQILIFNDWCSKDFFDSVDFKGEKIWKKQLIEN